MDVVGQTAGVVGMLTTRYCPRGFDSDGVAAVDGEVFV
jgi:hypothetical protein